VPLTDSDLKSLGDQLRGVFTPAAPISDPHLYSGRDQALKLVRSRIESLGMHFVIYGPRGIGKTSFGQMIFSDPTCHWYTPSADADFVSIFLTVLLKIHGAFTPAERTDLAHLGGSAGSNLIGKVDAFGELSEKEITVAATKLDLNFVLDRVSKHQDRIRAIVIDEFQRIKNPVVHDQIVQVIKGFGDRGCRVTIAVLGIADTDRDLIRSSEYREYVGRNITPIELGPLNADEIHDIFEQRFVLFKLSFPGDISDMIGAISCGYPSIVQALGLSCSVNWLERKAITAAVRWLSNRSVFKRWFSRGADVNLPNVGIVIEKEDLDFAVAEFVDEFERNFPEVSAARPNVSDEEIDILAKGGSLLMAEMSEAAFRKADPAGEIASLLDRIGLGECRATTPGLGAYFRARQRLI
jgi:hypothetical protein